VPNGTEDDPRDVTKMIAGLNSNMPVNRRTLMDYIENGDFTYRTKEGDVISFPQEGIDRLAAVTDDQEKLTLRLPVFVSTDVQGERPCWKVDGITETAVISKLLGRRVHSDNRLPIYYPDLVKMRQLIPELVFTLFLP
jgi:uncharacterized protein (UPF0216 family)